MAYSIAGLRAYPRAEPQRRLGRLHGLVDHSQQLGIEALDASHHIGGASIYPFVQNNVLGLRAEGLGTTLSTVLVPLEAEVKHLLRLPDGVAIAALLGVGWPAGRCRPACRAGRGPTSPPWTASTASRLGSTGRDLGNGCVSRSRHGATTQMSGRGAVLSGRLGDPAERRPPAP